MADVPPPLDVTASVEVNEYVSVTFTDNGTGGLDFGSLDLTYPPKRSPGIMLVNSDTRGAIDGQEELCSGADHHDLPP